MTSLAGKVTLITGGTGYFGQAFAERFLKAGCKVLLCDLSREKGHKCVEKLASEFGETNVKFSLCDVTSDESFKSAFNDCSDAFGRVDILVNNAGWKQENDRLADFNVNLFGTIRGTELALKHMGKDKGHDGGRVINIASRAGLTNVPFFPYYSTSKSAVIHYTRTMGHPFHFNYTGVMVQCICPNLVNTPFIEITSISSYNIQCEVAAKKLFAKVPLLEVDEVADALFTLIDENKPGAVMALEKDKPPYYVEPAVTF